MESASTERVGPIARLKDGMMIAGKNIVNPDSLDILSTIAIEEAITCSF